MEKWELRTTLFDGFETIFQIDISMSKKIISIWHVCVCVYVNIVKRYSFFGVLKTSGSNTNAHELNTSNYWCQQQFQFSFSLSDFVVDCDVVKFKQKSFVQSIFIPSYFPMVFWLLNQWKSMGPFNWIINELNAFGLDLTNSNVT